jgi:hypothetical protein
MFVGRFVCVQIIIYEHLFLWVPNTEAATHAFPVQCVALNVTRFM